MFDPTDFAGYTATDTDAANQIGVKFTIKVKGPFGPGGGWATINITSKWAGPENPEYEAAATLVNLQNQADEQSDNAEYTKAIGIRRVWGLLFDHCIVDWTHDFVLRGDKKLGTSKADWLNLVETAMDPVRPIPEIAAALFQLRAKIEDRKNFLEQEAEAEQKNS